jgi:integrase
MLIKDLSASWLDRLKTRKRKPIKPASLVAFSSYVRNWINPNIGDLDVETFNNGALKLFAEKVAAKCAPKTTHEIVATVKKIIASAEDANGNCIYPRSWNNDFILENISDIRDQHQPVCTKEMIKEAMQVRNAPTDKYRTIIALLLASGIRVGELVALRCGDDGEHSGWNQDNSALAIRTTLWNGSEQSPKTLASIRMVDLSAPVNEMLSSYAATLDKERGDYLFSTKRGTPIRPSSLGTYALEKLGIPGFHSCRRWRVSYLKMIGTPDQLLKNWIGHSSGNDVTARYDKSCEDREWRQSWANKCGIGFDLPLPVTAPPPSIRKPAQSRKQSLTPAIAEEVTPHYKATDDDLPEIFVTPVSEMA